MTRLTGAAKASHAARDFQALYGAALRAITRRDPEAVRDTLALLTAANEVQP